MHKSIHIYSPDLCGFQAVLWTGHGIDSPLPLALLGELAGPRLELSRKKTIQRERDGHPTY